MNHFNPETSITPRVLATDLDGTLIPLPESERNRVDLQRITEHFSGSKQTLVFATGRHFESALEAIEHYQLPLPEWIVCDVGSSIYKRVGSEFQVFETYANHLSEISGSMQRGPVEKILDGIEALEQQPIAHQQRFKISYQSTVENVAELVERINELLRSADLPYECMGSLDPFMNCGLLDVMPRGVSKAYALIWLSTHADFSPHEVIYSGDSGNDYAALVSGFRAIVVANGSDGLAEKVRARLAERQINDRLYLAEQTASSGVLEGCQHFGLIPSE